MASEDPESSMVMTGEDGVPITGEEGLPKVGALSLAAKADEEFMTKTEWSQDESSGTMKVKKIVRKNVFHSSCI